MTLNQRRHRLLFGIALCVVAISVLTIVALTGVERHVTLMSSMPLWPTVAILVGQWTRVRANIATYGPDRPEEIAPVSRKLLAAAAVGLFLVLAFGVILVSRTAP